MTPQYRIEWTRAGWSLGISAVSVATLVWLGASALIPIFATLRTSGSADNLDEPLKKPLQEHDELMQRSIDRFVGRSLFDRVPTDWPRPAPVQRAAPVVARTEPPPPPPPPPPQRIYGGPKPLAIIGDSVIFDGSAEPVRVGATFGDVKVLRVVLPYSVVVLWDRGEHTVPLFASDPTLWQSEAPTQDAFRSPTWTAPADRVSEPQWGDGSLNRPRTFASPDARASLPSGAVSAPEIPEPQPADNGSSPQPAPEVPAPATAPQGMPPPLTQIQVQSMSRPQVVAALARTMAARAQPNLDQATQQRLQRELEMLRARQSALPQIDQGRNQQ
ncbi:MAG: hypothetical protein FJ285_00620 [Planctomycetes bacterium]|nr:hypothetical protein [Planctomycetota bacterium]